MRKRQGGKAEKRGAGRRGGRKRQGVLTYLLLGLVFLAGLSLLLYPTVSDYWNSFHQSRAIMNYSETISGLSEEEYDALYQMAVDYNANISRRGNVFLPSPEEEAAYLETLNLSGNGVMGYINIPAIDVTLPIYHTTSERVLQVAIGHLEWTSLPVGGEGTHCVLSGHRGLPSARLFTDLDRLVVGDTFTLNILDEVLTYKVDRLLIVLPEEVSELQIVPGMDYCTLVTCTPYGINTHRMLVRGHRVENEKEAREIRVTADGSQIDVVFVAPVVGAPLLVILIGWLFADDRSSVLDGDRDFGDVDLDDLIRRLTRDWGFDGPEPEPSDTPPRGP